MKKSAITFAAALAATICSGCSSRAPATPEGSAVGVQDQDPQKKPVEVKADTVTFHVIGMKKTASGAT